MSGRKKPKLAKFDIRIGPKTYRFVDVALKKSPFNDTVLSHRTVRSMMVAVASSIVEKEETLSLEEVNFLASATEVSVEDCASYMDVDKEALLNWGDLGELPADKSLQLKKKITAFLLVERLNELPDFKIVES